MARKKEKAAKPGAGAAAPVSTWRPRPVEAWAPLVQHLLQEMRIEVPNTGGWIVVA